MDPISDMLTRIRNGFLARHEAVDIPYSNMKWELAKILSKAGYIGEPEKTGKKEKRLIRVVLPYTAGREPAVRMLHRISKPGRRVYIKKGKIFSIAGGRTRILSTSRGLKTDKEARKLGVGGEVVCEVM